MRRRLIVQLCAVWCCKCVWCGAVTVCCVVLWCGVVWCGVGRRVLAEDSVFLKMLQAQNLAAADNVEAELEDVVSPTASERGDEPVTPVVKQPSLKREESDTPAVSSTTVVAQSTSIGEGEAWCRSVSVDFWRLCVCVSGLSGISVCQVCLPACLGWRWGVCLCTDLADCCAVVTMGL